MWSEDVQMCLRRIQSQGLLGTGMKEQTPGSRSAHKAGASRAWARGLPHAGRAGLFLWRRSLSCRAHHLGPAVVLDHLASEPGSREGVPGSEPRHIVLGFTLGGWRGEPGHFLVQVCMYNPEHGANVHQRRQTGARVDKTG